MESSELKKSQDYTPFPPENIRPIIKWEQHVPIHVEVYLTNEQSNCRKDELITPRNKTNMSRLHSIFYFAWKRWSPGTIELILKSTWLKFARPQINQVNAQYRSSGTYAQNLHDYLRDRLPTWLSVCEPLLYFRMRRTQSCSTTPYLVERNWREGDYHCGIDHVEPRYNQHNEHSSVTIYNQLVFICPHTMDYHGQCRELLI